MPRLISNFVITYFTLSLALWLSEGFAPVDGSQVVSLPAIKYPRCTPPRTQPAALWKLRGGSSSSTTDDVQAEEALRSYLEEDSEKGKFLIQGWRWHTMSVMREAQRLQNLAYRIAEQNQSSSEVDNNNSLSSSAGDLFQLQKAADYVVNFNMKALHRVEAMFFPFVRKGITNNSKDFNPQIDNAFQTVMDGLEKDQKRLSEIGNGITRYLAQNSKSKTSISEIAESVAMQSGAMVVLSRSMLEREVSLVMPAVGRFVPSLEQKKFNKKVIKFLGVLESRCHLVHMHEVVAETNCPKEQKLWKESIPSFPRSMVPRWKRTLYEPRAGMLDIPP